MEQDKFDIEEMKNKLKLFGRKSAEKFKEIKDKIEDSVSESMNKGSSADSDDESNSSHGQKQPKNAFDRFLDKIPKVSIQVNVTKKQEEKPHEEIAKPSQPCPQATPEQPAPASDDKDEDNNRQKED